MAGQSWRIGNAVGCCNDGVVPADRLAAIGGPVLALFGGASAAWAGDAVRAIAGAVPGGRADMLAGQDHNPAPEMLAPLLTEFLC